MIKYACKNSDFYGISKHIKFSKLWLPTKSHKTEMVFLISEKGAKPPSKGQIIFGKIYTVKLSLSENPIVEVSSPYLQNAIHSIFSKKYDLKAVMVLLFFFCHWCLYWTNTPRKLGGGLFKRKSKFLVPVLSSKNNCVITSGIFVILKVVLTTILPQKGKKPIDWNSETFHQSKIIKRTNNSLIGTHPFIWQ